MNTRIITPPIIIKLAINSAICKRSTELIRKAEEDEITHQEYLAQQFPADAISYLEKAIDKAVDQYMKNMESRHED